MTETSFPAAWDAEWFPVADDTAELVAERLYDFGALSRFRKVVAVRAAVLPFYPKQLLCDVRTTRQLQRDEWISCLYGPDGVRLLSGDSEVIHGLNGGIEIGLAETRVQEVYLRFFCRFVHGDAGPFEIVLNPGQIRAEEGDPEVTPPSLDTETGLWNAHVLYGQAIFQAGFRIDEGGHVKMEHDTPIAENVRRVPDVEFDGAVRRLRVDGKGRMI